MPEQPSVAMRGLGWVLAAMGVALFAHVGQLPAWASVSLLVAASWRYAAAQRGWALPPRWVRTLAAVGALLFVLAIFRTVNGVQAGTALLAMMAAVKLLETRTERDLTVLVFIAYFLLYAALLRDQGITRLPLLLAGAFVATAALHRVHGGAAAGAPVTVLGRTAALAWPALPLALLLFVLFPRLPGPFWGVAVGQSSRTGLNDEIMLGDVSDLSVSGDGRVPGPVRRTDRRRLRSATGAARCCTSSTGAAGDVRWRSPSRSSPSPGSAHRSTTRSPSRRTIGHGYLRSICRRRGPSARRAAPTTFSSSRGN